MSACAGEPVPVGVEVTLAGGAPAAGVEVVAFPYDPAALLDSLEARHAEPRPEFPGLEDELRGFAAPAPPPPGPADTAWQATRDSVTALSDSLQRADRRAPAYRDAYRRFRALYGRLVTRSAEREAARRETLGPVRELATRAARAADALRAWERAAYAGLDSAAAVAVAAAGRAPVAAVTDGDGRAVLPLRPGRWWLSALVPHPENPFLEYRWSVPVVSGPFPVNVPLTAPLAHLVWRH